MVQNSSTRKYIMTSNYSRHFFLSQGPWNISSYKTGKSNELRNKGPLRPGSAWRLQVCWNRSLPSRRGRGWSRRSLFLTGGRSYWKSHSQSQRKAESPLASPHLGLESEFLLIRWCENCKQRILKCRESTVPPGNSGKQMPKLLREINPQIKPQSHPRERERE